MPGPQENLAWLTFNKKEGPERFAARIRYAGPCSEKCDHPGVGETTHYSYEPLDYRYGSHGHASIHDSGPKKFGLQKVEPYMQGASLEKSDKWHRHQGAKHWHPTTHQHQDTDLHEKHAQSNSNVRGDPRTRSVDVPPEEDAGNRSGFDMEPRGEAFGSESPNQVARREAYESSRARERMPERQDVRHPRPRTSLPEQRPEREPFDPDSERLQHIADEHGKKLQLSAMTQNPALEKFGRRMQSHE